MKQTIQVRTLATSLAISEEALLESTLDLIQRAFEELVREYVFSNSEIFKSKLVFFAILKTEGDILLQLRDFNRALQAYKSLRNYCKNWGMMRQEMYIAQQIGYVYRTIDYHEAAVDYFKLMTSLAWELGDTKNELRSYDNLSLEYYYLGDLDRCKKYYERFFFCKTEPKDSAAWTINKLTNEHTRRLRKPKANFYQPSLKGTNVEDFSKR